MANKKTARRALFTSVISLILCCCMLVGTTFAWFTDSVTSANNIIKSGTLDVAMYWADGTEDPAAATWNDASEGAIFNYSLWEPGYTEVRHIKIANEGNLALKYQVMIVANGEVSNLSDVIDVYYVDPAVQVADRAALASIAPMGTLTDALSGMATSANGSLEAEDEVVLTIALKMQESAGNEYQNLSIGSDFSVILLATQYTSEDDSFGIDYDENATYPDVAQGSGNLNGANAIEIEARLSDPVNNTKAATVLIPKAAVADPEKPILVTVTNTALNTEVVVNTDQGAKTYDVSVSNIKEGNTEPIKVQLRVGAGLTNVHLYHHEDEITDFTYQGEYVTYYTNSFSPFTVVYDAVMIEGGEGQEPGTGEEPNETNRPTATVKEATQYVNVSLPWGSYGQWSPNQEIDADPKLEAAYTFTCIENLEQAKHNPYANWYCDFYVSLDKDLGANQLFLGGNYGSFGWVGFHNGDFTPSAKEEIGLLESVSSKWTYLDVVQNVGTFTCGVGDVNDALTGATFTVKLRLTNPENLDEFYNIETINYTFRKSVNEPIVNVQPAPYVGGMYDEGKNVVTYKDISLEGNTYISIDNNASVAIENIKADVNGSVIRMKDYQPTIFIQDCEFIIDEGEYLIDASAIEGGVYQIFLVNVKVNGEYLTQETATKYLNNVNWFQALQA